MEYFVSTVFVWLPQMGRCTVGIHIVIAP